MSKIIKTKIFGGYIESTQEILQEALTWLRAHPNVTLADGVLYCDEGHYLTLYWEEDSEGLTNPRP